MKKTLIILIAFITVALAQKELSLQKEDAFIPLYKGTKLLIYKDKNSKFPDYGIILADSASYLVNQKYFNKAIRNEFKLINIDSLKLFYNQKIDNLNNQLLLTKERVNSEMNAVSRMQEFSNLKTQIAEEAIKKAESYRQKSIYFASFVGLVAGLLWINNDDNTLIQITKPLAIAGGAFYISISLFD